MSKEKTVRARDVKTDLGKTVFERNVGNTSRTVTVGKHKKGNQLSLATILPSYGSWLSFPTYTLALKMIHDGHARLGVAPT